MKKRTQKVKIHPRTQVIKLWKKTKSVVRIKVLGYVKMKATGKGRNSRSQGNVIGRTKKTRQYHKRNAKTN